ncbi:anti-sigma factor domain-containing protein [Priestia filamentosa]|uniref:anti-sigma factor domain-containing protein n=1 Tax=Priestia filamentosa TaxID=1402861 RepID=UPI003982AEAF
MHRGIILEKSKRYISVLTSEGNFIKVLKDLEICKVGEEVWFTDQDIVSYSCWTS